MRHLLVPPHDAEVPAREQRLNQLGLGDEPIPEFDDFARELAHGAGGHFAMVNFISERQQYFAGLYASVDDTTVGLDSGQGAPELSRTMDRHLGYCPHVIIRRKALVLEDVRDFPRFAGNPVVDEIGVHAYLGAPLIDHTGVALGTICVVDQEPRAWGREGLHFIKSMASRMVDRIHSAERASGGEVYGR
jgi:GAF domain-containing protein